MSANAGRIRHRAILAIAISVFCGGCWRPDAPFAAHEATGLIYMIPGIEGGPWQLQGPYQAIRAAGVKSAIRMLDWQRRDVLKNLTDLKENRRRAASIAAELQTYRAQHPRLPIDLVGYSGGGGLAVFVVEALPPEVRVRNVLLVHAALHPEYDLTGALRRIDGSLVVYYSPLDWFVLGLGTAAYGNMDRAYGSAAGRFGFDLDKAAPDAELRAKVIQRAWVPCDALRLHCGGHLTIVSEPWNRTCVAPYLLSDDIPASHEVDEPHPAGAEESARSLPK